MSPKIPHITGMLLQKCYWNNTKSSSSSGATRESVEIFLTPERYLSNILKVFGFTGGNTDSPKNVTGGHTTI